MRLERGHHGSSVQLPRSVEGAINDDAMPAVHSVEHSDGEGDGAFDPSEFRNAAEYFHGLY
jgi:hypothetical protein